MTVTADEEIPFDEEDVRPATVALTDLTERGTGWINLIPEVIDGYEPPPRNLFAWLFSNRGEPIPLITWTPAARPGGRATVGIAHGSGPRAVPRLAEVGLPLPAGWFKATDHARRGIVLTVPADTDRAEALRWLLDAAHVLCPVPLTGNWLARTYSR
ncbi:MAG: hypothetical protein KDB02_03625 [Acidimicrobiales bacterium]|nr:hypothetical protein [Acidimicrobiales bacterium]